MATILMSDMQKSKTVSSLDTYQYTLQNDGLHTIKLHLDTLSAQLNPSIMAAAIQDITYTATSGTVITIEYTTGGTAGSEVVTVSGNDISIQIQSGVSTATQVLAAFNGSAAAKALASASITGTAGTAQTAPASTALQGLTVTMKQNSSVVGSLAAPVASQSPMELRAVINGAANDVIQVIFASTAAADQGGNSFKGTLKIAPGTV